MIPFSDRALVAAVMDRIVPADDWPSFSADGGMADLDAKAADQHAQFWETTLTPGFGALEAECRSRFAKSFVALTETARDDFIEDLAAGRVESEWPVPPASFVALLTRLAAEGYYGRLGAASWRMIGFDPAPKRDAGGDAPHVTPAAAPFGDIRGEYDVLVIGAGAGGGVAAMIAAEAGARVLLVDRGENLAFSQIRRDHLANHRLPIYGQSLGPEFDGNPRVVRDPSGDERVIMHPHQVDWGGNAMAVGGGTRVYQGMAWRFLPQDFRLASLYGVPDGSSLADWPIGYDELVPFYDEAEWMLGVAGDGSSHRVQGPRARDYPMAPLPMNTEARVLAAGARSLGWSTGAVPLLINTEPYAGRSRCVQCGECVGFACPSDAKNGSFNTVIPRAIATGRCQLVPRCRALRIITDGPGRVTGAELLDLATGARTIVRAGQVVVAAGAVETARLLMLSASDAHPNGLGNHSDQVGRHLQGHPYVGAFGLFDDPVIDMAGPGVRIGCCDFNHGAEGVIGGGVLHNEVIKLPMLHWLWALPPDAPRRGLAGKATMREAYRRTGHVHGPIQEIPHAGMRVTLAPGVVDALGQPVARLEGALHAESVKAQKAHRERAVEWLSAAGAKQVWRSGLMSGRTAGQHQAGTCRMGADPATSVTDPWGRVHGHENLWVMDASVHVTNGGFNPVLNIYALAFRNARAMAGVSARAAAHT
jgi:choline dehydrogenase-like flavoprotein